MTSRLQSGIRSLLFVIASTLALSTPSAHGQCVAVGLLNADTAPDAVVVNSSANTISVLLNTQDGTGAFNTPVSYVVGTGPTGAVIADVNQDSKPDVVVCNRGSGTISVLINNGDGTLKSAVSYSVLPAGVTGTPSPSALAVGDVLGDGLLDVVVANYGTSTISVLKGDNQGVFKAVASYAVGSKPDSVALAKFTNSGLLDIVTANSNDRSVSVLLGNADGTFQTAKDTPAGYVPYSVIPRDYDGDGIMDVAICDNMGLSSGVDLLKGNGDGTFHTTVPYSGGANPIAMVAGDFNNDGRVDLATVNSGSLDASVFLNDGSGGFASAISVAPSANHIGIGTGDFDGDGNLELILANAPSGVTVVPATAPLAKQLTLSPSTVTTGEPSTATLVLTRRASSDGVTVTITADRTDVVWVPTSVVVPAGAASATFRVDTISPLTGTVRISATTGSVSATASLTVNPAPPAAPKGDLNGDGKIDILDLQILARVAVGLDTMR